MGQPTHPATRPPAAVARPPPAVLDLIPDTAPPAVARDMHSGFRAEAGFPPSVRLLKEWDELATRASAEPYLFPGWVEAWWRAFGSDEPELLTLRKDGRLAALLPLMRHAGDLESAANYHTPSFGMLAEDAESGVALARTLFVGGPTRVSMTSLDPAATSLLACRQVATEADYRVVIRAYQRSLYLDLRGSWYEYESGLGRNLVRNLRRARKQLGREGTLSVEIAGGREHLDQLLHEAFGVEASGWKGAGRTAIESDPHTRNFYTDIARWAAGRGMLRLFFLRLDGRPLAVYLALEHRGICHLLKGGYDAAYSRQSPGTLLMHSVIRNCFEAGLSRIEFNGDAEPYKFSWAAAVRECKRLEAFAPTTLGRLAWAEFILVRPLRQRLLQSFGLHLER